MVLRKITSHPNRHQGEGMELREAISMGGKEFAA
jgi:hypothetical protein